ncbi:MAG: ATP-binding cassette domain-containing protein [Verrucomicrobia bacterium]|nr:ATP-binding cassette domain-containing protein [Verrucomicrobiota bacterium]
MAEDPIIKIEGIERKYVMGDDIEVMALDGVNISIHQGEYVAIMGPSGSGKSTMLNLLGCLDRPTAGSYWLGGEDVAKMDDDSLSDVRGRRIGFIFQSYNLIAQLTVLENIQVPLFYQGKSMAESYDHCVKLANLVGLGERLTHRPNQLSGGQQQRVAIARSLVNDPLMILADEPTGNLDSKTGLEVLDLIDDLNDDGKTIVLVTHDNYVAERAHRVIHMKDGHVDRAVQLGIKTLLLHKLRSGLTMLGIIFGVCSVIAMLAIGEGASFEAQERIKALGSNNIIVRSVKPPEESREQNNTSGRGRGIRYGLTYDDASRVYSTIPGVERVLPMRLIRERIRFFEIELPCQVIGTLSFYPEIVSIDLLKGRFIAHMDEVYKQNVCVLTSSLAQRLFPYHDPLEQTIKIAGVYYRVVGLVREINTPGDRPQSGESEGETLDNNVYIPLSTCKARFGETLVKRTGNTVNSETVQLHEMRIQMKDHSFVESADPQVRTMLSRFHREVDYEITVPLQLLRQAEATKRMFNIVLGSIAAISLIVGGIGIMNIMLANVTERTREIGVRRALGGKKRDIITQFLVETVVLSIGGGLVGVVVGVIVPLVVTASTGMQTIITWWSVALAFSISGAIGVVFGIYPANAAASLDPIEALRHE